MKRIASTLFLFLASSTVFSQHQAMQLIHPLNQQAIKQLKGHAVIQARNYQLLEINLGTLRSQLNRKQNAALWIDFPMPNGQWAAFQVEENNTMAPGLKKKYPNIQAYNGFESSGARVKWDITPRGFHAMIMQPGRPVLFIDPYLESNDRYYILYTKQDMITSKKMHCDVNASSNSSSSSSLTSTPFTNCALKKYRLALAATYSYTQFNGGTKASALAAEVTTVNRINGIFETDIGVTMELIPNNVDVICDYVGCPNTPAGTQPYTSGNAGALIEENQVNTDIIIGSANYDFGHVLDAFPGSGNGLAALASVCDSSSKASATSISPSPQGDAYDVDFVSHEMGHQFGATHTQNNNCNRDPNTSVEPGSGSTIMGYAGICAPNVQNNSGPYLHGISMQQIGEFTQNHGTCSVNTPIPQAPVILGSNGNSTIPFSTPFALVVAAQSVPQASLTYDWEQMDPTPSPQPPQSTSPAGPNFRSFDPVMSPIRNFPNLAGLASGNPTIWEVLSSVGRTMHFRISVRNNTSPASCNAYQDYTVTVDNNSGPFTIIYPNANGITWQENSRQIISWNVAGTNLPPVNAPRVDILLSTDGGLSFPITLAANVANSGARAITAPRITTTQARIMVRSTARTFFNISEHDFSIGATGSPTLVSAERDPLQKTTAFIYFTNIPSAWFGGSFTLIGYSGATVTVDVQHQRFVISGLRNPHQLDVAIHIVSGPIDTVTNTITIPSILG